MNKELEEAIKTCNEIVKENKRTIKILKGTLKSKTEEEYLQEQIKSIETVLNYIDNSISKEVIEEKIVQQWIRCPKSSINEFMINERNSKIEILQELLEGK